MISVDKVTRSVCIPSDYVKNQENEIKRAIDKFLSLAMKIIFASTFSQDKMLNDEIDRILDDAANQFANKFIKEFGDEKFNKNLAETLGLNICKVFFSGIVPMLEKVKEAIK